MAFLSTSLATFLSHPIVMVSSHRVTGRAHIPSILTHGPSLQVLDQAQLRKPVVVQMLFSNPLDEPVKNCVLMVEGSGLLRGSLKIE